jgi:hypothetical protein
MNAYAADWGVTAIPVTVTSVTYRGLDYREPTWPELVASVRGIVPTDTPFMRLAGDTRPLTISVDPRRLVKRSKHQTASKNAELIARLNARRGRDDA